MLYHLLTLLAAAYGEGGYNTSQYNVGGSSSASGGGTLVDTGFVVGIVVALAVIIILVSLAVRFFRRSKSGRPTQPTAADREG